MFSPKYLRSVSGTVLWLIKLVFACFIFIYLFNLIVEMQPIFQEISKQSHSLMEGISAYMKILLDSLHMSAQLGPSVQALIKANLGIVYTVLVVGVTLLLTPILIILDGIGATLLRFFRRGSGLIRICHHIHAALNLIAFIDYSVMLSLCISNLVLIGMANLIVFSVALGLGIVMSALSFFYHRDIVKAMKDVRHNLDAGPFLMEETHLSGLSFTAFIGWLLFLLMMVIFFSMSVNQRPAQIYLILMMLQQLCVARSYRELKKYNHLAQERESL